MSSSDKIRELFDKARAVRRQQGMRALAAVARRKLRSAVSRTPASTGVSVRDPVPPGWLDRSGPDKRAAADDATDKISVIIPSYCHSAFIREAILSVACQTYPNIELVVVDDGSTDDSVAVIEKTLSEFALAEVTFVQQTNQGAHAAINRGIELSTGRYISILNSDDVYHPDRLAKLHDFAESGNRDFVVSEILFSPPVQPDDTAEDDYRIWLEETPKYPSLSHSLLRANGAGGTSNFFFRADLIKRIGPFRELILVHDWDFVLRAIVESEPAILREALILYRRHPTNTLNSLCTLQRSGAEYRSVLSNYFEAVRSGRIANLAAPSPSNYGDYFFEFLSLPTPPSQRHWIFPTLIQLWRTSGLTLAAAQQALTPPDELMELVGSLTAEQYHAVGAEFIGYFIEFAGLDSNSAVLDIGCGSGRIAIPLTQYLDRTAKYTGFDIVPAAVEWCAAEITAQYPNFEFNVADIRNSFYNPDGPVGADEYRFPHDTETFDFVFLTSVFTHMLPAEVEHYLSEIQRVLKPGGRCLATFFLENAESRICLDAGVSVLPFPYAHNNYRTFSLEQPEFAVCYREQFALGLFAEHGLDVLGTPRYGSWCGRSEFVSLQDIILAEKRQDSDDNSARTSGTRFQMDNGRTVRAGGDEIQLVCVSHRSDIYERYVGSNRNLNLDEMTLYDNRIENVGVSIRYNHFIEHGMRDGWVVFMHHDVSFDEPLEPLLDRTPKDAIYGVIGAVLEPGSRYANLGRNGTRLPRIERGRFVKLRVHGQIKCVEELAPTRILGEYSPNLPVVDTVDCCCVIVHSSLVRQHRLRFDPQYAWHFYSEEFSLSAWHNHGIQTRVLQVDCGHYGVGDLNSDFRQSQRNMIKKFGSQQWASTCYIPPTMAGIERFANRRGLLFQY